MGRDWKPGDVALVRLATREAAEPAIFGGDAWHVRKGATSEPIEEPRPLVVIDPEDREQTEALAKALVEAAFKHGNFVVSDQGLHERTVTEALRSLIASPKPPEPTGKFAAVIDDEGSEWVRLEHGTPDGWLKVGGLPVSGKWTYYDQINAVRVLSEGVQ